MATFRKKSKKEMKDFRALEDLREYLRMEASRVAKISRDEDETEDEEKKRRKIEVDEHVGSSFDHREIMQTSERNRRKTALQLVDEVIGILYDDVDHDAIIEAIGKLQVVSKKLSKKEPQIQMLPSVTGFLKDLKKL